MYRKIWFLHLSRPWGAVGNSQELSIFFKDTST